MENFIATIQQSIIADPKVTGLLVVHKTTPFSPLVDGFDALFLVVMEQASEQNYINHYSKDGLAIQERRISQAALWQWIVTGENRSIIEWILQGEICLDRDTFLESTRHRLLEFPLDMREQKLLIEFSLFLRRYLQSKQYLKNGHHLDAHSNILEALHHWAGIAIIEQGYHPEVTVWQQIKKINPGVYKLYEELTLNEETLEQRVQLVLLACEFNVMSKMADCCRILIKTLEQRELPFSPMELKYHPILGPLHVDMALLLKQLVKRGLIREVITVDHGDDSHSFDVRYTSV